ncbi:ABC transporter permease [Peribacillus glennii]|uniref:Permease n=1 Tax=Peribacillus glennii TaxID=2303991 RepID=A0A372LAS8_9BACI|nr:ABC transporter permease [Peribacillus glennii]RFU62818.1 permease [Peribacillus glennii]
MLKLLQADMLKVKRKWLWFLVFLGPFGVIALQIVNYRVRYDYLIQQQPDVWKGLMENVNMFVAPAMLLGMTIIASQLANIEHQQSSWKHLLSLPIRRRDVFSSKFMIAVMMLIVSCLLLFIGTILLGVALKFGWDFPFQSLLGNSFYPLLAGLPVLALQIWLSITFQNQAYPLTLGISGAVFCMLSYKAPVWFIWKWPLILGDQDPNRFVLAGILVGFIFFLIGMVDFQRRDVK